MHSSMKIKKNIPPYVEHIHFLVTRAGWIVTKIYKHYTFQQTLFKKEFVTMNLQVYPSRGTFSLSKR